MRRDSEAELDRHLELLADRATEFARLAAATKASLLRECMSCLEEVAPPWVVRGCLAKGMSVAESGEEWLAGPVPVMRLLRLFSRALDDIAARGRPRLGRVRQHDGAVRVRGFPFEKADGVLFPGFTGEVVMQPGSTPQRVVREQAAFYQRIDPEGGVSLVLGAGNVSSIPPTDVLTKMFVHGQVCILKMNPVNEWVGPHLERTLRPLVARGYLRIVYGAADVGAYLANHPLVADVHITGSDATHDFIVWGPPGEKRERRMEAGDPLLDKPMTSELGNVSPVAIVPYDYSEAELVHQAESVASMVVQNASFNCNAAKVLITARGWRQRQRFLHLLRQTLGAVPTRKAYYPGAFERYQRCTENRHQLDQLGNPSTGELHWAFLPDLDSQDEDELMWREEPFCGILAETQLGSSDPIEFLAASTRFMNETLWGTLNACLVVHPRLERDALVAGALAAAVRKLRYGILGINQWPALAYAVGSLPWGGHPSSRLADVQSGLGWVHNSMMLDGIEKVVVRGPLRAMARPIWFAGNRSASRLGPRLLEMAARPKWSKVPNLLARSLL